MAAFSTGNLDRQSWRELDWNYLVLYGVLLSMSRLVGSLGLNQTASEVIGSALSRYGITPTLFIVLVGGLTIVTRLLVGEQVVLLLSLALSPVAPALGVDPGIVVADNRGSCHAEGATNGAHAV